MSDVTKNVSSLYDQKCTRHYEDMCKIPETADDDELKLKIFTNKMYKRFLRETQRAEREKPKGIKKK